MNYRKIAIIFTIFIFSFCISECKENQIYFLNLNYNYGDIELIDVSVRQGYSPDRKIQPEDGYKCEVVSFSDKILYSFKFLPPLLIMGPPPLEGEEPTEPVYLNETDFTLLIPYFRNAKSINIYDSEKNLKLSVDVSSFSDNRNYLKYIIIGILLLLLVIIFTRRKSIPSQ